MGSFEFACSDHHHHHPLTRMMQVHNNNFQNFNLHPAKTNMMEEDIDHVVIDMPASAESVSVVPHQHHVPDVMNLPINVDHSPTDANNDVMANNNNIINNSNNININTNTNTLEDHHRLPNEMFSVVDQMDRNEALHRSISILIEFLQAHLVEVKLDPTDPTHQGFLNEPNVPLYQWVQYLVTKTHSHQLIPLVALHYLNKLVTTKNLQITNVNVFRLTLVSLMMGTKVFHDIPIQNKFWANCSGKYCLKDINKMEVELLSLLQWQMDIASEEFKPLMLKLIEWN